MSAAEQMTLDEFHDQHRNQCRETAASTGKRCEHDAIPGLPYCTKHVDALQNDVGGSPALSIPTSPTHE
jgi:hypothetical protein